MRFLLIFCIALAVRLWFNFFDRHVNNFASCDAYEYLQNARALLSFSFPDGIFSCIYQVLSGDADSVCRELVKNWLLPLQDFKISGPVFPAFLALVLGISGTAFVPGFWLSWPALLLAHSCVSAVSCILIMLVAQRAFNVRVGVVAGWLACFYPAFIVNSGRLYSETFAAFLSLALLSLLFLEVPGGKPSFIRVSFLAINAMVLQLTRSAMFVFTLLLMPLILWQERPHKPFQALFIFVAVFMLSVSPWLFFQKLAFDKASLVLDRVGNYNFFIGNNVDTLGWLSLPYPNGCAVQNKTLSSLAKEAFSRSPSRWLKLMADKPARLFQHPWNDFRTAIGPFCAWYQVRYHQWILCLALIGLPWLFLSISRSNLGKDRSKLLYRLVLAFFWLFHCIYFGFITVPRYNLTAMPVLIIFAAFTLVNFSDILKKIRTRKNAGALLISVVVLLALLSFNPALTWQNFVGGSSFVVTDIVSRMLRVAAFLILVWLQVRNLVHFNGHKQLAKVSCILVAVFILPLLLLPLRAEGRYAEWSGYLPVDSKAQFSFDLPSRCTAGFLFLNSSDYESVASSVLEVNGIALDSVPVPGIALVDDYSRQVALGGQNTRCEGEMIFDAMTAGAGMANMDLRQWYVWLIPQKVLDAAPQANKINVSLYSPAHLLPVFGSLLEKSAAGKSGKIQWPDWRFYSWEKAFYGVENDAGLSDTSLDLGLSPADAGAPCRFVIPGSPGLSAPFIRFQAVPSAVGEFGSAVAIAEASTFKVWQAIGLDAGMHVEKQVDQYLCDFLASQNFVVLEVEGKIKGDRQCTPAVQVLIDYVDKEAQIKRYVPAWVPRAIPAGSTWKRFAFAMPLDVKALPGKVKKVSLCLNGTADSVNLFNIRKACQGSCLFEDVYVRVRPWHTNPVK